MLARTRGHVVPEDRGQTIHNDALLVQIECAKQVEQHYQFCQDHNAKVSDEDGDPSGAVGGGLAPATRVARSKERKWEIEKESEKGRQPR